MHLSKVLFMEIVRYSSVACSAFVFHLLQSRPVQSVLVKCNVPASVSFPFALQLGCHCVVWCLAQITRTVIAFPLC